jgi:hypothetical protein
MVRRHLRLRVAASLLHAELVSRGQVVWSAEAGFDSVHELEDVIAALAGELPSRSVSAHVVLLPPVLQVRHLDGIPPVRSQRALDGIVASQSGRFFRHNGHPLATSAHRVRSQWFRRPSGQCIAAAVEQPWLDAIGAGLESAGLVEGSIGVEGPKPGPEFRSGKAMLIRVRRIRRQIASLTCMALLLWGAAAITLAVRLHRVNSDLETGIQQLREPASAALAARAALQQAQDAIDSVAAARSLTSPAVKALAELSEAMPDSAFLTSLDWSASVGQLGAGTMTGAARHAVAVVAALEHAGFLRPRLEGAPVGDQSGPEPRERFVIRFGSPAGAP